MANRRKGLVIIPAYNEEACICQTVERVRQEAVQFDVVVIDDCSTDRTREICAEQGFPCIGLSANLGIGGAVQTGYRYARGKGYEMAVQFDADGQHDVACLPRMVRCMEEQRADLVVGSRFLEKEGFQSSAARRAGIRWFSWLIRFLTGVKSRIRLRDFGWRERRPSPCLPKAIPRIIRSRRACSHFCGVARG